jgi:hypothetical protein
MRPSKHERKLFSIAAMLTIISAIIYCSWPLGFLLNPGASRTGLASELGAIGQPYNWVFIWGDIVSGALLLMGSVSMLRLYKFEGWAKLSLILLAVYGLCGAFDASIPMTCLPSEQACGSVFSDPMLIVHGIFDMGGSVALIGTLVSAAIYVHDHSRHWRRWIWAIGAAGTLFFIVSGVFYVWGGPGYWAQRYYITLSCVWVASVPFVLRPRHGVIELLNH